MTSGGKDAPTREQAQKITRVFGVINIVLGAYCILGAIVAFAEGPVLPLGAVGRIASRLGLIVAIVVWAPAVVGGIGLALLSTWGRQVSVVWGRIIVWVLPIAFGLASKGLGDFISLGFALIIAVCFYANVMAANLARGEFDTAFAGQ